MGGDELTLAGALILLPNCGPTRDGASSLGMQHS